MRTRTSMSGCMALALALGPAADAQERHQGDAARLSVKTGIGNDAVDLEVSVDTVLWADILRVRAGLAHGRWRDPAAAAPRPQRTAANRGIVTVLVYAPPVATSRVRVYGGAGSSHYLTDPWFGGPLARRVTAGAEGTWRAWTIGAEWELEKGDRQTMRDTLTARVGIAIRRSFLRRDN